MCCSARLLPYVLGLKLRKIDQSVGFYARQPNPLAFDPATTTGSKALLKIRLFIPE
jgi:hypothetical protein